MIPKVAYSIIRKVYFACYIPGLWCADRAALYALVEVEKLKKKTAYDRHYLLLCMIFTVMARVRLVSFYLFSYSLCWNILFSAYDKYFASFLCFANS